jgi:hypothetical protein
MHRVGLVALLLGSGSAPEAAAREPVSEKALLGASPHLLAVGQEP